MLAKRLLQGLVFVATFVAYDLYVKDIFYSYIVKEGEAIGLFEVAVGYAIAFTFAYLVSSILVKHFRLDEEAEGSDAQYDVGTGYKS